ncbi:MAG: glycosyltransferase family 4 protein [Chloroflexi bacterium]|nr:glycosyltransferase family 4 protein [Chloroflexota bacterium]
MKILIVSKILVVAAYRRKLEAIAAHPSVERLVAVTGPEWREPGGRHVHFEPASDNGGYEMRVEPIWLNGSYHLFLWPRLAQVIRDVRPDLVHIDEEPYNLATAHGTWAARHAGARSLFFTWQNLLRRYPPPFRWFERSVFARSAFGIAGSREALQVLRAKGYCGPGAVIPQFGIDPDLFSPATCAPSGPPVIGYMSRLVEEKGVMVLLAALAGLRGDWRLHVIGTGPLDADARQRAAQLGLEGRITWERGVASTLVPERLRTFSMLVQPSLTRSHWKEQFGRALTEAMACGVPVIGSSSAEIPNVVGAAGLIVPEGDADALGQAIGRLLADPELRHSLAERGRARALGRYTHARIAEQTVEVYESALAA